MLRIVLTAAVLLATAPASAISRYNSTALTCQQARAILAREGAAIIRYPSKRTPGLTLYDRFVQHWGLCDYEEEAQSLTIPTAGGTSCTLLRCIQRRDDRVFRRGGPGFGIIIELGRPFD